MPHLATGTPPGNVGIRLDQSPTASVSWTAPPGGGQTGYLFIPLAGNRSQELGAGATSAVDNTAGVPTCYLLMARVGGGVLGIGAGVCAIPGLTTLN